MTYRDARYALTLIYELTTGYKVSEANLSEDRSYAQLKEATLRPSLTPRT